MTVMVLFVCLGFTSHRHSIGHMATFQLYVLVEEDLRCPFVHYLTVMVTWHLWYKIVIKSNNRETT
jgi:hypothetical protein